MKTIHLITISMIITAVAPISVHAGATPGKDLSATDWSSIRGAYEAARHAVRQQENGTHAARNPGQQWSVEFDGRGFLVIPDHGMWTWGLELHGTEMDVSNNPPATTAGNRITYRRGENLDEWFVNDHRGLEQGWTIKSPVTAPSLSFRIRGGLIPRISEDGCSVTFRNFAGTPALNFGGLKAWDAQGKAVETRFAPGEDPTSISIRFDDRGASYPITIDPIAQQAYLKASNTGAGDEFGYSLAASGNTVVVGARGEDSNATGVNGAPDNNNTSGSGAAYVFVNDGNGNWSQQGYLKASNTGLNDSFGFAVAIDGDIIVVSANAEDSNATGVNGDGANNSASDSGAAYVFVRSGTTWSQQAYLKASNTGAGDEFGYSVAVSGNTVVVGSFWEDSAATGINGDQSSSGAPGSGAAYVFVRSGTTWSQQAYLKASNSQNSDHFGTSVGISDETVIVGSPLEDSAATGVNGNQINETAPDSGAAYIFVRSGTTWSQQAYLKASNTNVEDYFGWSVAISGDMAVVGAEREDSGGQQFAGAAYVYARSGVSWSQQAYLKSSDSFAGDRFGRSVAASGAKVLVGAPTKPGGGRVYVFTNDGIGNWSELTDLNASNPLNSSNFGISVAISDDLVIVGANNESSAATGVNGNGNNNDASQSGAAYVINLNAPAIADIAVKQPEGDDLTSGVSTVDFGQVTEFDPTPLEFVIRSTGTINLTGISASIVDNETGDYFVTTPPETLAPGTSTVVTVYFTPQGGGNRIATLSITSDDPDESPFDITLTGFGINAAWQAYKAATAAAGLSAPNDDPAASPFGDGVENLLKYAFNMSLAGPDSQILTPEGDSGLPAGTLIEETGQIYWKFQFMWNLNNGLIYSPKKSTDLVIFEPMTGDLTTELLAEGWERITIKEPIDITLTPKLFTRIEVTLP